MRIWDSHVHLDVMQPEALPDRLRAHEYRALVPGIRPADTDRLLGGTRPDHARIAAALHPWYVGERPEEDPRWPEVRRLARDPCVVAIGETGLDHYRYSDDQDRHRVRAWFEAHVRLAVDVDKPLVVHCVRAHGDCVEAIERIAPPRGGVIHAFSGSPEIAARYRRSRFLVGIGAAVTRPRSTRVRHAAAAVPDDQLLVETDAPFMAADEGGRGAGRADDILRVIDVVAELRGSTPEEIAELTWRNAEHLFGAN